MHTAPSTYPTHFAITGSSGFIGRNLVRYLSERGHTITCVSRQAESLPGTRHRQVASYLNVDALASALEGADVVVHLAARAHMLKERDASPDQAFQIANHDSALAVARAARFVGVGRFVMVSSIGVNGNRTDGRSFTAADVPRPAEPYAQSKWEGEKSVTRELAGSPTSAVIVRPTLVYGDDCPGNFRLLLNLVYRLPLIPLGGVRRKRSLIHVDNLCDALIVAARHPSASDKTFVLSDGLDLSVAEVARILCRGFGKNPRQVVPVPETLLRMLAQFAGKGAAIDKLAAELKVDIGEFRSATGWMPPIDPVEGLERTARHFAASRI